MEYLNPDTKDYILVLQNEYFEECSEQCYEEYTDDADYKWCKSCQINEFKAKFTNWSGNE